MFRAETQRAQRMGKADLRKSARSARKIIQFIRVNQREKVSSISARISEICEKFFHCISAHLREKHPSISTRISEKKNISPYSFIRETQHHFFNFFVIRVNSKRFSPGFFSQAKSFLVEVDSTQTIPSLRIIRFNDCPIAV